MLCAQVTGGMTRGQVTLLRPLQFGCFGLAALFGVATTRLKITAGGRVCRVGDIALQDAETYVIHSFNCGHFCLREAAF